jgi:hypothetical protein
MKGEHKIMSRIKYSHKDGEKVKWGPITVKKSVSEENPSIKSLYVSQNSN